MSETQSTKEQRKLFSNQENCFVKRNVESSPTWGPKRPKMAKIHGYLGLNLSGCPQVNFWLVLEAFFPANADADADADAIKL